MRGRAVLMAAGIWVVAAVPGFAADTVLANSNFNTDLDGWTSNTPAEISWTASGGHPKGGVQFNDMTSSSTYVIAPAKFLSPAISYTGLSGRGYISWEHRVGPQSGVQSVSPYEIRLSGPNGAAKFDGGMPPSVATGFVTVTAPLQEADWTVTSGTWAGLLANVTQMQIDIELITNATTNEDVEYMDNVQVVYHPAGFVPGPK